MRPTLVLCSALLLFQQQCNVTSPDALKSKAEDYLRPYFPNAKVMLAPSRQNVIVLTCTHGIGPSLLPKFQDAIANDSRITTFAPLAQLALQAVNGAHYRSFLLYFDSGIIQYDLDAKQVSIHPITQQQAAQYDIDCGGN